MVMHIPRSDIAAIRSGCDAAGIALRQETAAYNDDQSSNFIIPDAYRKAQANSVPAPLDYEVRPA
jgi:hypothetical protein